MIDISQEEQEKILNHLQIQLQEIRANITIEVFKNIRVTCPDCDKKMSMLFMYRCFQCGLWICVKCAPKHFNIDKSKLPKYVKSKKKYSIWTHIFNQVKVLK